MTTWVAEQLPGDDPRWVLRDPYGQWRLLTVGGNDKQTAQMAAEALNAADEIERLRAALKPFAVRAKLLDGYEGSAPDLLVQMGITADDCKRAAEVLK